MKIRRFFTAAISIVATIGYLASWHANTHSRLWIGMLLLSFGWFAFAWIGVLVHLICAARAGKDRPGSRDHLISAGVSLACYVVVVVGVRHGYSLSV